MALHLSPTRFLVLHRPFRFPPKPLLSSFVPGRNLGFRPFFSASAGRTMQPAPSPPSPSHSVRETIDLTEKEEKIFRRLLEVIRHFGLETQLRVAGGWVRDKLLGKECYDIDIALDNMLGQEFCEKVNTYLQHTGEEKRRQSTLPEEEPGIGTSLQNKPLRRSARESQGRMGNQFKDFVTP